MAEITEDGQRAQKATSQSYQEGEKQQTPKSTELNRTGKPEHHNHVQETPNQFVKNGCICDIPAFSQVICQNITEQLLRCKAQFQASQLKTNKNHTQKLLFP